jgi:ribosomal protein S18 acetylase RimI-like enzyme
MTLFKSAITIEKCDRFKHADMVSLCEATMEAIEQGIGFNWSVSPSEDTLEAYWKGVLLIPERTLFLGRLDGTVAGAVQMVRPVASRQAAQFAVALESHFVAPWARGHGLAKALLKAVEEEAKTDKFEVINLHVRETQEAALRLYQANGYHCWGVHPYYEIHGEQMIAGHYFTKHLNQPVR